MKKKRKNPEDTSVPLHPLSFEDAIAELATPKHEDSQAKGSCSTKEDDPASESSKPV